MLLHYIHTIKLITSYIDTDVATPTQLLITKIAFRALTFGVMVRIWLVKFVSS